MSRLLKRTLLALLLSSFCSSVLLAQEIRGVVKDAEGKALYGVSVIEDGTSNGTMTGEDGSYKIMIKDPSKATLQFSMIGMKSVYKETSGKRP